jgi:serine/threonine-protein kinase
MLTGKRLFQGEDVSDILASIIKEQPNLNDAPPRVLPLLRRCLEKDPKKRLRDIGDWELLLEKTSGTGGPAQTGGSAPLIKTAWVVAGTAIVSSEIHGKYFIQ